MDLGSKYHFTADKPWETLGTDIDPKAKVKEMLKKANLDWKVERQPIFTADGTEVPDFAALQRDSDGKIFDIAGSRYIPTQNEQAFEFFLDFVHAGKAKMQTLGTFGGGKIVWGMADLGVGFELKGGDKVGGYLLCVCPHKQGKSLLFKTTSIRVWCKNTLTMAIREAGQMEWRMGHRTAFDGVKVTEARAALGIARDQIGEFEVNARKLQKIKMTQDDMVKVLTPIIQKNGDEDSRRMQALIAAYESAPGAQPGNAWGVLNAYTYYADHMASRSADKRLENAWLGRTANQKEAVLERLLQLA